MKCVVVCLKYLVVKLMKLLFEDWFMISDMWDLVLLLIFGKEWKRLIFRFFVFVLVMMFMILVIVLVL